MFEDVNNKNCSIKIVFRKVWKGKKFPESPYKNV